MMGQEFPKQVAGVRMGEVTAERQVVDDGTGVPKVSGRSPHGRVSKLEDSTYADT